MIICGTDEVGISAIAGPIVGAAYAPHPERDHVDGVRDSKQLNKKERAELFKHLIARGAYAFGVLMPYEADGMTRRDSSIAVMEKAVRSLPFVPDQVISDYYHIDVPNNISFPRADEKHYEVSAASIIAKHARDTFMAKAMKVYPGYHWDSNAGYPSRIHRLAILKNGFTGIHRLSAAKKAALKAQGWIHDKEAWTLKVAKTHNMDHEKLANVDVEKMYAGMHKMPQGK